MDYNTVFFGTSIIYAIGQLVLLYMAWARKNEDAIDNVSNMLNFILLMGLLISSVMETHTLRTEVKEKQAVIDQLTELNTQESE